MSSKIHQFSEIIRLKIKKEIVNFLPEEEWTVFWECFDIDVSMSSFFSIPEDQKLSFRLDRQLSHIVNNTVSFEDDDEGYCTRFRLPSGKINALYTILGLDKNAVFTAFENDWGSDTMKHRMYRNPHYHILILIILFGFKVDNQRITEMALTILIFQIWNGRMNKYFHKYCNKHIMDYVVTCVMPGNALVSKHDSPSALIRHHFVPEIIKTYKTAIINNPEIKTMLLIQQPWNRIRQIFANNYQTDLSTGKPKALHGLAPEYYRARDEADIDGYLEDYVAALRGDELSEKRHEIADAAIQSLIKSDGDEEVSRAIQEISCGLGIHEDVIYSVIKTLQIEDAYALIHNALIMIFDRCDVFSARDVRKPDFPNLFQENVLKKGDSVYSDHFWKYMDELAKIILMRLKSMASYKYLKGKRKEKIIAICFCLMFYALRSQCKFIMFCDRMKNH